MLPKAHSKSSSGPQYLYPLIAGLVPDVEAGLKTFMDKAKTAGLDKIQAEYAFPVTKEKQLVDFLMVGKSNEAQKVYSEIVNETEEYPYSVVQLAISHLMLTINSVINTIKKNNALIIQPDFDSSILSFSQVESIEEINLQFFRLFEELKRKLVFLSNV